MLPIITDTIPNITIDPFNLNILSHIQLADSSFHTPEKIDLLIGADLFDQLLSVRQIHFGRNKLVLKTN